jgi:RAQPRD family integrative conjugative element protein
MFEADMKINQLMAIGFLGVMCWTNSHAGETQERVYLTQIVNQLNAIKPLIVAAQNEQPQGNRVKFHYSHYINADGRIQNGLLDDINAIEAGVREKLDKMPESPHEIKPIAGDFIDHHRGMVSDG